MTQVLMDRASLWNMKRVAAYYKVIRYSYGAERYNLVVTPPEHKLALYGAGGGVPPLSRPTRPSALHLSRHPSGCLETKAVL